MTKVALIFPGQGAQKVGMGKEFYDTSPDAKSIFDTADQVLTNGLTEIIFQGPNERLTSTAYCQPAIFSFSIAALMTFKASARYQNISVEFTAGLSLGEYSALTASGALSFEDTLRLVERRSFFMEEATKLHKGKMAAIIGFDQERLQEICKHTGAEVANFNAPGQIVITGHADKVHEASRLIKEEGAKAVIPLEVGGAFHSSLMQPAAERFSEELKKFKISTPDIAVVSNVNGMPAVNPMNIQENLAKQITSPVQWVASIEYMVKQGIENFIEIGPGKVLKGLIRKINAKLKVYNIEKPEDIETLPFNRS